MKTIGLHPCIKYSWAYLRKLGDPEQRVTWDSSNKNEFIREWHERGYPEPPGWWSEYGIHHITPKEYGETNDFDNLVPVD